MQAKEDAAKRLHEVALLQMNIDARGQEMENEAMIAQVQATAEMLKGSYEHDASYGPVGPKAASVLRFMRPALTFTALILAAALVYTVGGSETKETAVLRVLTLAEIAFTWWFADRGISKRLGK
jgi:hypothetical protein